MTDERSEQFDVALQGMLEGGESAAEFKDLLVLCERLREMPRTERKAMAMPSPTGVVSATPMIFTTEPDALLNFLKAAFGAQITDREVEAGGGFRGGVRMGEGHLRVIGGAMAKGREIRACLHYFVDDVDEAYRRAIAAGAEVLMGAAGEPADRPYGERSAFLKDPFGNQWFLGKHLGIGGPNTGELRPHLYPKSARALIIFLEAAFGAKGLAVHEHQGRVMHAQVRIGDSVIEMGEGDESPQALSLRVDNLDTAYARALAAGATSVSQPSEQQDGERVAGVVDPFGNRWDMARRLL